MLKILYKMLEDSKVYNISQKLLGGDKAFRAIKETIARQLSGVSYNNVLDVGCGTGLFMDCFEGDYMGIDINYDYMKRARGKKKGDFIVADATRLHILNEKFDIVFNLGVLHHLNIQQRRRMLLEMRRVGKRGGHILIVDGLVPSDRSNVIGFILAKLDRGRYKMRIEDFMDMISLAYGDNSQMIYTCIKSFPHEFVSVVLQT